MSAAAKRAEHGGGDARPVAHAGHGEPGLVAAVGDAADDLLLHDLILIDDERARLVLEARQYLNANPLRHGERHRARLQHLGAERGQLEHLLVGDAVELVRLGHDPGIAGVDAVDIGEDVAALGRERRRHGDGRGVRATAAERGDAACRRQALKAGDHGHLAGIERRHHRRRIDLDDPRLAVRAVGRDPGLPAGERPRRHADRLQGDRQQADGHLLARGHDRVVLGRIEAPRIEPVDEADELVGLAGHGRQDDANALASADMPRHALGDMAYAL